MMRRDDEPGRDAAGEQREDRGGEAEDQIFVAEGADQHAPRGAERLQHHGIVGAGAVAGGKRAGEHQHRGDQRDGGCGADGGGELADQRVDDVERILDADAGDRRIGVGDGPQDRGFVVLAVADGSVERRQPGMRRAARRCWARTP